MVDTLIHILEDIGVKDVKKEYGKARRGNILRNFSDISKQKRI